MVHVKAHTIACFRTSLGKCRISRHECIWLNQANGHKDRHTPPYDSHKDDGHQGRAAQGKGTEGKKVASGAPLLVLPIIRPDGGRASWLF
jgi:hypothetical protein